MSGLAKQVPTRLGDLDYKKLHLRVLRRDRWKCQLCGSMTNLEVHHQQFRSDAGEDTEENLVTFCTDCHASAHGRSQSLQGRH